MLYADGVGVSWLLLLYLFTFGTVFGSFFNVVVYRVPQGLSVAKGRSFCPHCEHTLRWLDLVPVLSFLCLKGRCRYCGSPISPRYPLVETLYGCLYVLFALLLPWDWSLPLYLAIASILVAIALIDMDTSCIPDSLLISLVPFLFLLAVVQPGVSLPSRLLGLIIVSLPMLLLALLIQNAFGGGDMKLMALCGFLLGPAQTLLATFIAVLLGGLYALFLLATKRVGCKATMPFGQFLILGVFSSLLFGSSILAWYLQFFNF